MKLSKNKGFTLIELLVVVLIIGILAAVALPQYQGAVAKSRAAGLEMITFKLAELEELYYLANGEYTTDISLLDVEIPQEYECAMKKQTTYFVSCQFPARKNLPITFIFMLQQQPTAPYWAGVKRCWASKDVGDKVCKSLGYVYSETDSAGARVYDKQ